MIGVKTIVVPKNKGTNTSSSSSSGGGSGGSSYKFEPHYLWGQYFDDTQDIDGNIVSNGNISGVNIQGVTIQGETVIATDKLIAEGGLETDEITANTINTKVVNAEEVNANKVNSIVSSTKQVRIGDEEGGQWIIEETSDVDLNTHIAMDKTFRVSPNNVDVFDVSQDKVKINKKLDLTNTEDGTNVSMGMAKLDSKNTNLKSIVENGFYICDNDNNVAVGITHNYVMMGADMGSPNFYSGNYGWRVQPDGTAEFQNLKVNGNLDVFVLTYNEMRATNGILLVTDVGCVTDAIENTIGGEKYWIFTIDEYPPFAVDDFVQLQYRVDETRIFSFRGLVTAIGADGKNTVRVLPLSGFHGEGTSDDDRGVTTFRTVDPETATGQYLIRIGNKTDKNRQTIIKLNPYDGSYIDFMRDLNSETMLASEDSIKGNLPTNTRIGNLAGVVYKGTTLEGYGLYSENVYLTGAIKHLEDKWSLNADGSGQVANKHISWDKDGNLTIMLGDTNITQYITNIANELEGKITTTKTELEAKITATAEALTSDYTKKITETTEELGNRISTVTTELEGKITQTAESLTSDYTKKITETSDNLNGKIRSATTELEGKIQQSAEALTSDYTKKISETADDLEGKISSATIELEGKIAQTANSLTFDYTQKITNVNNKISTVESNFTQTADSISTRVKKIEDDYVTSSQLQQTADSITAKVGNFDVGATNLLRGTKKFDTNGTNLFIKDGYVNATEGDFKVISGQVDDEGSLSYKDLCEWTDVKVEAGNYYTLSFYASGLGSFTSFLYHVGGGCVSEGYNSEGNKTTASDGNIQFRLTSEFKRYWVTWKVGKSDGSERVLPVRLSRGADIQMYGVKFERGNVATDWSPSPADNDNGYATSSELTMTADSIKSRVTTIENNYVKSSEISQTADNILLQVHNELSSTGIDISDGVINLNADNTNVVGRLNLKDSTNGLSLYDTNNIERIKINTQSVGTVDDYNFTAEHWIQLGTGNKTKASTADFNVSITNMFSKDGNVKYSSGEKLILSLYPGFYGTGTLNYYTSNNTGDVTLDIYIYSNSAYTTQTHHKTFTLRETYGGSYGMVVNGKVDANIKFEFEFTQEQYAYVKFNIKASDKDKRTQFVVNLSGSYTNETKSLTHIGIDGIVRGTDKDHFMWLSDDEIQIRWKGITNDKFGGDAIRFSNDGFQRTYDYDVDTHQASWIGFDCLINDVKSLTADGDFHYQTPISKEWGDCNFHNLRNDEAMIFIVDNKEGTKKIDPMYIILGNGCNHKGGSYYAPMGRKVTIKNLTDSTVYVVPDAWGTNSPDTGIMRRDSLTIDTRVSIGNNTVTFVAIPWYMNSSGIRANWMVMHQN